LLTGLAQDDITRMRDQLFFDGLERNRRLSRFWLLLPLAAVIASAGVVSDSTATVIGAMIVAPLMTPILGIVLAVALTDGPNLRRCLLLVIAGAAQVLIQATGPNPAPSLPALRQDLAAAGLNGLDVRVSLVPASYKPLPG
jgi:uncharacterized membrane protein